MTEPQERFLQLRKATAERLARMTAPERDELLQIHLAEAMGPRARFRALVRMTTAMLELNKRSRRGGRPDH